MTEPVIKKSKIKRKVSNGICPLALSEDFVVIIGFSLALFNFISSGICQLSMERVGESKQLEGMVGPDARFLQSLRQRLL